MTMGKMRVHELAKELGLENRALLDILAKKKVEVKNHMNSLEESVVSDLRREFGKKPASAPGAVKPAEKAETAPKKAEAPVRTEKPARAEAPVKAETADRTVPPAPSEKKEEAAPSAEETAVPKKKKIVQIFRPQNAKNPGRMSADRKSVV